MLARFIFACRSKSIEAWEKCHQLLCPGGFVSFDWPCTSFKFKTSASRTWLRMDGARNYFNILVNGSGVAKLGNSLKNTLKRIFGRLQVISLLNKSCRAMYVDRMLLTCTNWCLDWYWLMLSKCVFPSAFTTRSLQMRYPSIVLSWSFICIPCLNPWDCPEVWFASSRPSLPWGIIYCRLVTWSRWGRGAGEDWEPKIRKWISCTFLQVDGDTLEFVDYWDLILWI